MAGEVIACNAFEDLFSPFSYLCYAQANDFDAFIFFSLLSLEEINLHIQFISLSITDI